MKNRTKSKKQKLNKNLISYSILGCIVTVVSLFVYQSQQQVSSHSAIITTTQPMLAGEVKQPETPNIPTNTASIPSLSPQPDNLGELPAIEKPVTPKLTKAEKEEFDRQYQQQKAESDQYYASLKKPIYNDYKSLTPLSEESIRSKKREIIKGLNVITGKDELEEINLPERELFSPWVYIQSYSEAGKNKKQHALLIKNHLQFIELLLSQTKPGYQHNALGILAFAIDSAVIQLQDVELGVNIVEAFLIPNLSLATPNRNAFNSEMNLMRTCLKAYSRYGNPHKMECLAGHTIKLVEEIDQTRSQSDAWRIHLAKSLMDQGKFESATTVVNDIHSHSLLPMKPELMAKINQAKNQTTNKPSTPKPSNKKPTKGKT